MDGSEEVRGGGGWVKKAIGMDVEREDGRREE